MVKQKLKIEESELIIIAFFAIFGIAWMRYALPCLQYSDFFISLNPPETYILYNIGIITLFVVVFGIPVGYFIKGNINIIDSIRGGFASFIGFSFFLDMWSTPFAWNTNGILSISPTSDNIEKASVDYMVGWTFQQFNIQGSMLYLAVYVLIPIISIIIMALILKPKELLSLFEHQKRSIRQR